MTIPKINRWFLLATICMVVPLLIAQSADEKSTKPTVVYVVRHAEKTGETPDADLSEEGKRRVEVLTWMLRDVAFDAVYSTNVARTLHTVKPIAAARGLKVDYYAPKPGALAKSIEQLGNGRTILVGGHSNTIPVLLKSLGVPIKEEILAGYDDLFVVALDGDRPEVLEATLQRLHYPGQR